MSVVLLWLSVVCSKVLNWFNVLIFFEVIVVCEVFGMIRIGGVLFELFRGVLFFFCWIFGFFCVGVVGDFWIGLYVVLMNWLLFFVFVVFSCLFDWRSWWDDEWLFGVVGVLFFWGFLFFLLRIFIEFEWIEG